MKDVARIMPDPDGLGKWELALSCCIRLTF